MAIRPKPNDALAAILAADQAAGVNVFDDGPPTTPLIGPVVQLEPLLPPALPEPDWRAEQEEARRQAGEEDVQTLPPSIKSLSPTPAPRR